MPQTYCEFSVILEGSIPSLIESAKSTVEESGGMFVGDLSWGEYIVPTPVGEVRGVYTIEGVTGEFYITKRPPTLSCQLIKSHVVAFQTRLHALEQER